MLNFSNFIQVYVFTTNHHLKSYRKEFASLTFITWTLFALKAPNKNCSRRHFNFLHLSFEEKRARFFM